MRPCRGFENGNNPQFTRTGYAVTHVVYVFNDYGTYLRPEWLPEEYEFLRSNLTANLTNNDSDLMGEFLDSLKALGLTDADPLIRTGIDFLLSRQNPDGSWSEMDRSGAYMPYHAISTACNGLSDYSLQREGVTSPMRCAARGARPTDLAARSDAVQASDAYWRRRSRWPGAARQRGVVTGPSACHAVAQQ